MGERHAFYLIREEPDGRPPRLSFNIGGKSEEYEVVKLEGEKAWKAAPKLIQFLLRVGGVYLEEWTDSRRVYVVRDDLGPIVGAYILALKDFRGNNVKTLEKIISGELPVASAMQRLLQAAIELTMVWEGKQGKSGAEKALDVMASTTRYFIEQAERVWADGR